LKCEIKYIQDKSAKNVFHWVCFAVFGPFSLHLFLRPKRLLSLHLFFVFCHVANQPESKVCIHGYLFPLPVALGPVPHPSYDATAGKHEQPRHVFTVTMSNCNCSGPFCFALAVFRGFWTVLVVLGLVAALTGGFLLVCGVPFASHRLLTLGGAFLLAAGKDIKIYTHSACFMNPWWRATGSRRDTRCQPLLLSAVHTRHMATHTHTHTHTLTHTHTHTRLPTYIQLFSRTKTTAMSLRLVYCEVNE